MCHSSQVLYHVTLEQLLLEHPIYECVTPFRYHVTLEQLILEHPIYESVTPLRYHMTVDFKSEKINNFLKQVNLFSN